MTISAKIIADSVSQDNTRLITVQTRYPKFIHGELMTHRVFSRNASSSRAIPVGRLIKDVIDDPVNPSFWGLNQPGMSADKELDGEALAWAKMDWEMSRNTATNTARNMSKYGMHKQVVNRILEPYSHINTLITSTLWSNFFELRLHKAAQPEMRMLAEAMLDAMKGSEPNKLRTGQWHLPYVDTYHHDINDVVGAVKLSVARCARVSYLTQEGKEPNIEEDLKLYDRLLGSTPLHASPAEHQATPDHFGQNGYACSHLHGNLTGWIQARKLIEKGLSFNGK